MQTFRSFLAALTLLSTFLPTFCNASQMQLNYYSDHGCSSYLQNVQVSWADSMATNGQNCYNYHYGSSVNIANCWAGDGFCMCQMYYNQGCSGDYATVQYSGYNANSQWEWNCLFNAGDFQSFRCYYY